MSSILVGKNGKSYDFHLYPNENLYTGIKSIEKEFGKSDSLEEDLLNLASGIYGTDLAIKREERQHYIRDIQLSVEVNNLHAFERIKHLLERALLTISRDNWKLNFIQKKKSTSSNYEWEQREGIVLLFSGGIDSMCAAAEYAATQEIVLVSHNSQGNRVIDESQKNVHNIIEKFFKKTIRHIHVKVYGRKKDPYSFPEDRENTQRTRSFLFLSLAALITRKVGFNKVLFMAENGQFAIHLPLNSARIGPFSTHTADPEFIKQAQQIFQILLNNDEFEIINPFMYKTKAEVFSLLPNELKLKAFYSCTCWMISHVPGNKHCGYCIPCISRRISLEYNNISFNEYAHDIFSMDLSQLNSNDDKKRNLVDYLEFISKFKEINKSNKTQILHEFPELYNPAFDTEEAIKLYERISKQSLKVFEKYPNILKLLG